MSVRELTSFIYHRDHRRCRYCDRMLRRSEATVDHYRPRHLGGDNDGDNLRLSCHPCNSEKGCMPPEEWEAILAYRRALRAARAAAPRPLSKLELLARCAPYWKERIK